MLTETSPDRLTLAGLAVLHQILESMGCDIVTATDLNDALAILQNTKIDTAFCTLSVSGGTAFDLLSRARERDLCTAPFIIITIVQTPNQDQLIGKACTASGAIYMNLSGYDSDEEMRCEVKKLIPQTC